MREYTLVCPVCLTPLTCLDGRNLDPECDAEICPDVYVCPNCHKDRYFREQEPFLQVEDKVWGINRAKPSYGEKVVGHYCIPFAEGFGFRFGPHGYVLHILKVEKDSITFEFLPSRDKKNSTFTMTPKSSDVVFRPRSFDAGHIYTVHYPKEEKK